MKKGKKQECISGNFNQTESVSNTLRSDGTRTARIDHNLQEVAPSILENPSKGQRKTYLESYPSQSTFTKKV